MSKIIINGGVFSLNSNEKIDDVKAVLKDNKINYVNNGINVSIMLLPNKIILKRENKDMKLELEFEENKTLTTSYIIKDLKLKIKMKTKTKKLCINNSFFKVEYDLFVNGEYSDSFTYNLEWRDL